MGDTPRPDVATRQRAPRLDPEVRRSQLIDVGAHLFARHGYEHVTIDQIATSVGLMKGGFYHHFQSKQDLLVAIAIEAHSDGLRILTAIGESSGTAADRFDRSVRSLSHWVLEHADQVEIIRRELSNLPRNRLTEINAFRSSVFDALTDQIAQGQAEGAFDARLPARFAAHSVLGMVNWLALWRRRDAQFTADDLVAIVSRQALGGLAGTDSVEVVLKSVDV